MWEKAHSRKNKKILTIFTFCFIGMKRNKKSIKQIYAKYYNYVLHCNYIIFFLYYCICFLFLNHIINSIIVLSTYIAFIFDGTSTFSTIFDIYVSIFLCIEIFADSKECVKKLSKIKFVHSWDAGDEQIHKLLKYNEQ